jgi:hypothetical protein
MPTYLLQKPKFYHSILYQKINLFQVLLHISIPYIFYLFIPYENPSSNFLEQIKN